MMDTAGHPVVTIQCKCMGKHTYNGNAIETSTATPQGSEDGSVTIIPLET